MTVHWKADHPSWWFWGRYSGTIKIACLCINFLLSIIAFAPGCCLYPVLCWSNMPDISVLLLHLFWDSLLRKSYHFSLACLISDPYQYWLMDTYFWSCNLVLLFLTFFIHLLKLFQLWTSEQHLGWLLFPTSVLCFWFRTSYLLGSQGIWPRVSKYFFCFRLGANDQESWLPGGSQTKLWGITVFVGGFYSNYSHWIEPVMYPCNTRVHVLYLFLYPFLAHILK